MVGERGIDVVTGGGPGMMEAASSGHQSGRDKSGKKSHSIGLAIKLPKEERVNGGVNVVKEFEHFSNRLDNFMVLSNVIVVSHGGVGTLLELFYSWQLMQVEHICNVPIILMGDMWKDLIKWLEKEPLRRKFLNERDIGLLFHAKDCNEVIKMIDVASKEFKNGNKNYCLNYKKYKLY
jgi:predicted Rossmann-fold nucleotide-binding protein